MIKQNVLPCTTLETKLCQADIIKEKQVSINKFINSTSDKYVICERKFTSQWLSYFPDPLFVSLKNNMIQLGYVVP